MLEVFFKCWNNEHTRQEWVFTDSKSGHKTCVLNKGSQVSMTPWALWPLVQWNIVTCLENQLVTLCRLHLAANTVDSPLIQRGYLLRNPVGAWNHRVSQILYILMGEWHLQHGYSGQRDEPHPRPDSGRFHTASQNHIKLLNCWFLEFSI